MKKSSLTENITYNENKPSISVLFETETTKEIRVLMQKNQVMKEHYPEHEWNKLDFDTKRFFALEDKNLNMYYEVLALLDEYYTWLDKHDIYSENEKNKIWNEFKPVALKKAKSYLKGDEFVFEINDNSKREVS